MAAMMLPTIVPMVLAHRAVALRRSEGALSTFAFVTGYALVWSAVCLAVWLAYPVFGQWSQDDAAQSLWQLMLAASMLFYAGLYQFTGWKRYCADMCRSPLTFVFTHNSRKGVLHALRAGVMHGEYCFGCCWGLMVILFVMGIMHLGWMAAVGALILVEKLLPAGKWISNAIGAVFVVVGGIVALFPETLARLSSQVVL